MKKILCFLLILTLFLPFLTPSVLGEERGKITLVGEEGSKVRGDSFSVYLELNRNPGITSLLTTIKYNPDVLEVFSVTDQAVLPGFVWSEETPGSLILRWKAPEKSPDLTGVGKIAQVMFQIKSDAPYGKVTLEPQISQRLYDASNQEGHSVPFDVRGWEFDLSCPHLNLETRVTEEPTFSKAGEGRLVCLDCNSEWDQAVLPTISSDDGKTIGKVHPGEYEEEDVKGLRTEFVFGGEQAALARSLFPTTLIRTFHITFTKNESIFVPTGVTEISLAVDFELPEEFVLYVLKDNTAKKVDARFVGGSLIFDYASDYFVLVSRETVIPTLTTTTPATEPATSLSVTTTLSAEEEARRNEIRYVAIGVFAVVFCGTGAAILLRTKKRF